MRLAARADGLDRVNVELIHFKVGGQSKGPADYVREVLPRRPDFHLQDGGKTIKPRRIDRAYVVERAEGGRLRIRDEDRGAQGWTAAADVVQVSEAEEYFSAEIRRDPGRAFPYLMRARSRALLDQTDRAVSDLNEALRLEPERVEALAHRAWLLMKKGNGASALADIDHAIRLDPAMPGQYLDRAAIHEKFDKEKPDLALADVNQAIRLDPTDPRLLILRADLLVKKGKIQEAFGDTQTAVKLNPKDSTLYMSAALIFMEAGQHKHARELLTAILGRQGDKDLAYECHLMLSLIDLTQWRFFSASSRREQAIALDPAKDSAYLLRAAISMRHGFSRRAMDDINTAIRLNPRNAAAYEARSVIQYRWRQHAAALADMETAAQLSPDRAEAHRRVAPMLATCPDAKIRRGREAIAEATRACELSGWKSPYFVATLAAAEAEAGDFRSAVMYQERAIALLPKYDLHEHDYRDALGRFKANKPSHRLGLLEEWGIRGALQAAN